MSVAVVSAERTSPGPISGAHAQVEGLAESSSCSDCHGGLFGSMKSSCLDCHEPIANQLDDGTGLHGVTQADHCASCHSEHNGPGFMLVNAASFARLGLADRADFDHGLIGWEMGGEHLKLDCAECHENADVAMLETGTTRFLGLSQDCSSCHEDVHEGRMRFDCTQCHTQEAFEVPVAVDHDRYLHLTGGHEAVGCRDCHGEDTAHRLERIVWPKAEHPVRGCVDCHDSPHAEPFAGGVADLFGLERDASCAECHRPNHRRFAGAEHRLTDELHAASGFPLDVPHDAVGCEECHGRPKDPGGWGARFPGRRADDCASCHEDVHEGQFDTTADGATARTCVECHERTHFDPHAFDLEQHDRLAFGLEGTHRDTDCNSCHQQPDDHAPRLFRGTPSECAACHEDVHEGFFDPLESVLDEVQRGDCARCHQPTTFEELVEQPFDHGLWTGFGISGAHEQSGCASCHGELDPPLDNGRGFAFAEGEFGPLEGPFADPVAADASCASCHFDPHEGEFDTPDLPAVFEDRAGCARCHGDASFRAFPHGFDHGLWTEWPLDGQHAALDCSACHEPQRPERPGGRSWGRAAGASCADCHEDVHLGQFESEQPDGSLATSCERCHTDTRSFGRLDFDHDWDSRFPLHEAHERVDCAGCHKPVEIDGETAVRYRPLGRDCTDCHGVRAGSLRRGRGR